MMLRERKRVLQVVRTVYDPKVRRGRQEIVASLPKAQASMTEELRSKLTHMEAKEVSTLLVERGFATAHQEIIRDLKRGPLITRMARAVACAGQRSASRDLAKLLKVEAPVLWAGVHYLSEALESAGHLCPDQLPLPDDFGED